jgi:rhodanese-related sulfurtransferase
MDFVRDHTILIIVFMAGSALLWMRYGLYLRGVRQVDADSARKLVDERQALLVDVREKKEYDAAHIPGSTHIPLSQMRHRLRELERHRGQPLVISCRSGSRSAKACLVLKKNGFEEVYNLKGGILAWARAVGKGEK